MRRFALALVVLLAGCGSHPTVVSAGMRAAGPAAAHATSPRREKAIHTYLEGRFANHMDPNHDGKSTKAEWEKASIWAGEFKDADTDKDGAVDLKEFAAVEQNGIENETRQHESGFKILLSQADRNHDGKIAGKELVYKPNGKKTYDYRPVDFNNDGEFSVDEYVDASWNLSAGLEPATPL
jgi:Ca2+-binding EF-hand superfamily protein